MPEKNLPDPPQGYPPGMQKFINDLAGKTRLPGTHLANIDCEICGKEIKLVPEMNIFVYNDAPYHTTKALCHKCCAEERLRLNYPDKN